MDLGLQGKIAVVAGASKGLGRAVALGLRDLGIKRQSVIAYVIYQAQKISAEDLFQIRTGKIEGFDLA